MTISSNTSIKTAKASGYLQQLCKHFGHKIEVNFTPQSGWIKFDFGKAELDAASGVLTIVANAENNEDLAKLKHVMISHLERFAFRETLAIEWSE